MLAFASDVGVLVIQHTTSLQEASSVVSRAMGSTRVAQGTSITATGLRVETDSVQTRSQSARQHRQASPQVDGLTTTNTSRDKEGRNEATKQNKDCSCQDTIDDTFCAALVFFPSSISVFLPVATHRGILIDRTVFPATVPKEHRPAT